MSQFEYLCDGWTIINIFPLSVRGSDAVRFRGLMDHQEIVDDGADPCDFRSDSMPSPNYPSPSSPPSPRVTIALCSAVIGHFAVSVATDRHQYPANTRRWHDAGLILEDSGPILSRHGVNVLLDIDIKQLSGQQNHFSWRYTPSNYLPCKGKQH